jgi:hypothetical protein
VTQVRSRAQSRIRVQVSIWVKTQVRRPGKTKRARQGHFFTSGSIRVEGGDLKKSEPRSPSQEEDQRIRFKFKDRVKEEIGPRWSPRLRTKSSWSPSRDQVRVRVDKVSKIEPL